MIQLPKPDHQQKSDCIQVYVQIYVIRGKEEISEQIKALKELTAMAKVYGFDISQPAKNVQEAIQWTYFGYLGAVKEQNGAAMSLGRTATFLDVYAES